MATTASSRALLILLIKSVQRLHFLFSRSSTSLCTAGPLGSTSTSRSASDSEDPSALEPESEGSAEAAAELAVVRHGGAEGARNAAALGAPMKIASKGVNSSSSFVQAACFPDLLGMKVQ